MSLYHHSCAPARPGVYAREEHRHLTYLPPGDRTQPKRNDIYVWSYSGGCIYVMVSRKSEGHRGESPGVEFWGKKGGKWKFDGLRFWGLEGGQMAEGIEWLLRRYAGYSLGEMADYGGFWNV